MLPIELSELTKFAQWVVHRADKTPLRVKDGYRASVSNPDDWDTYENAVSMCRQNSELGLGFVLTDTDPFACIDLDDSDKNLKLTEEQRINIKQLQQQIFNTFTSYSEFSPSGKGIHIWIKGSIPSGKKKDCIETYSSSRYITVTGNAYKHIPIAPYPNELLKLYEDMGGSVVETVFVPDQPEIKTDDEIISIASSAVDGDKFNSLMRGDYLRWYSSQSEADVSLANIIAFYTDNRYQCGRIFRSSELGKRDKAQRQDYLFDLNYGIVTKAFDRKQVPVNLDQMKENMTKQFKALKDGDHPTITNKDGDHPLIEWTRPNGLLGEIADFIYDASYRPVREVAVAGAIAFLAGIAGRAYNISGQGLNQYVILLAATGRGKEGASSGIDTLVQHVANKNQAINQFIGPSRIESSQGLFRWLSEDSQSFVSVVGEVGLWLQAVCGKYAKPNDINLRKTLLEIYTRSGMGRVVSGSARSDKANNIKKVLSPSFTLFGESTQEEFYKAIDESNISEGFLPRLALIDYNGIRPKPNRDASKHKPSDQLIWSISSLVRRAVELNLLNMACHISMTPEAKAFVNKFEEDTDRRINEVEPGDKYTAELWNRAHLKVLKLAGLLAVGCDIGLPVVTLEQAQWAHKLVVHGIEIMLKRFDAGEVGIEGNVESEQRKHIAMVLKGYVGNGYNKSYEREGVTEEMFRAGIVTDRYLQTRLKCRTCFRIDNNPRMAYVNAIRETMDAGYLVNADLTKFNKRGKAYHIMDVSTMK